jgi:signal transduction histidine kinase
VTVSIAADLPALRGDPRLLKQMTLNLLANAVKFTPPGGRVEISASAHPETGLRIAVSDTGIGIAKDDLAEVTQPFFQVDGSLDRRHEGTGLGLALVAAMMERHGGALRLDSEIGRGTTAILEFPRERLAPPRPRPATIALAETPASKAAAQPAS